VNTIQSYTAYIISDQWLELACSIELEMRWKSWYLFVGVAYGARLKYVITDRFFLLRPVHEESCTFTVHSTSGVEVGHKQFSSRAVPTPAIVRTQTTEDWEGGYLQRTTGSPFETLSGAPQKQL